MRREHWDEVKSIYWSGIKTDQASSPRTYPVKIYIYHLGLGLLEKDERSRK